MTAKQVNVVRERLVSLVKDTNTPIEKVPRLVNTLINFEHGLVDLEQKKKNKQKLSQIGLKHD